MGLETALQKYQIVLYDTVSKFPIKVDMFVNSVYSHTVNQLSAIHTLDTFFGIWHSIF